METASPVVRPLRQRLDELMRVVRAMPPDAYRTRTSRVSGSVGEHVRHVLDHVASLVDGNPSAVLSYDHRLRGTAVETEPHAAMREMARLDAALERWDQPLDESVAVVEPIVKAGEAEGVPFALNARTDAFVRAGDRPLDESIADAIQRGRAFLDAGATCVFVPGILDADVTAQLVEGIGRGKISVIGLPGALTAAEYEALGVARISYGPMIQRVALTALQDVASSLYADGVIPGSTRALN